MDHYRNRIDLMAAIHQMMLDVQRFYFNITTNQTNANLRTLALAAGWDGITQVVATINSGIYISSNATGTPALTINGSFPNGVRLNNNGFIVGMGGNGGTCTGVTNGGPGSPGGLALSVSGVTTFISNSGTIAGGGGGGGAGGASLKSGGSATGGGGGGGRSSNALNSSGGGAGTGGATVNGNAGADGTVIEAGGGGSGGIVTPSPYALAGGGGNGGDWGTAGSNGGNGTGGTTNYSGGSGGSAGGAISGDSNITWLATGTRLGSIT